MQREMAVRDWHVHLLCNNREVLLRKNDKYTLKLPLSPEENTNETEKRLSQALAGLLPAGLKSLNDSQKVFVLIRNNYLLHGPTILVVLLDSGCAPFFTQRGKNMILQWTRWSNWAATTNLARY